MQNIKTNSIIKVATFLIVILSITNLVNAAQGITQTTPKGLTVLEWNNVQQQIKQQRFTINTENIQAGAGANYTLDAYIKASNTDANDFFGYAVALSGDTMVVGAYGEDSITINVDGEENNNLRSKSGAAFVFVRGQNGTWNKQAYLKADNNGLNDQFGFSVGVSGDLIIIGSPFEDSNSIIIDSGKDNNDATNAGAAYVFKRSGSTWHQQAYLKAENAETNDQFGYSVGIDGTNVIVGARFEDSNATGVNNINSNNNDALRSGAAYVFVYNNNTWSQQAYLKAPNTDANDYFGNAVDISGDSLVVGAILESSSSTGVNNNGLNNSANTSGAAYVFTRSGTTWSTEAYLKASNTGNGDLFGFSVAVSMDVIVVGSPREDSNSTGVNGSQTSNTAGSSGAAYVFNRIGSTWSQQAYLKSLDSSGTDYFGASVDVLGNTLVVGAYGDNVDTGEIDAGAAFVFTRNGLNWSQQAYLKAPFRDNTDFLGQSVSLSNELVVVGAFAEDSNSTGVNNDGTNDLAVDSGAVYAFKYVPTYNIGGNVSGLADANSIILRNNNGDDLTVTENGSFAFLTQLADLSNFDVSVVTQPSEPNQDCVVTGGNNPANNGSGSVSAADVTNIVVTCTTEQYSIGGTLMGLGAGSVILQNNHGNNLTLSNNGPFAFSILQNDLSNYSVSVLTHPTMPEQTCGLLNDRGRILGGNVTEVIITCNTAPTINTDFFNIPEDISIFATDADGTDTGTSNDNGIFVNDNDVENDTLSVVSPGTYTANGIGGEIEIFTDGRFNYIPPNNISGQAGFNFDVTDGIHIINSKIIIDVYAINDAPSFSIVGDVDATDLINTDNPTAIINNFAFDLLYGADDEQTTQSVQKFNISISSDSNGILDSVLMSNEGHLQLDFNLNNGMAILHISLQDNGGTSDGGVDTSQILEFSVSYTDNQYSIGGTLSGLGAGSVVLQNNLGNNLTLSNNGAFSFSILQDDLSDYDVSVLTQPTMPEQTCGLLNETGSISGENITAVMIICNTAPTTITDNYSTNEDNQILATDVDGSATGTNNDNGVLANDSDIENDTLSVVSPGTYTANGIGGEIEIFTDGRFNYSPPNNISGQAGFTYDVTDGTHTINSEIIINVAAINDAPSFSIVGDVDATGLISFENPTTIINNFAYGFLFGADDEQTTQSVQQFNINISSDSNGILDSVLMSNDGHLQLDFNLSNGVAILHISLQDDGGTSDGGVDTSQILEFSVSNTDTVYANGFEGGQDFRLLDFIEKVNIDNKTNTLTYDFNSDSLLFENHQLQLFDDYGSSKAIQRVKFWISELLLSEQFHEVFKFGGINK